MTHPLLIAAAILLPGTALAHDGAGAHAGFLAGLLHPMSGADHLLAMVMLGLWAGMLGGRARVALPGTFLGAMALGGLFGAVGIALPLVEPGILASLIVLGGLAALVLQLPLPAAVGVAALAGLLHGHAHGAEMLGTSVLAYGAGFLLTTAMLLGVGLALAAPVSPLGRMAARCMGGATAVAGLVLLLQ